MKAINYPALRAGDVLGVTTPASIVSNLIHDVTGGNASHVIQAIDTPFGLRKGAEMLQNRREVRYFNPEPLVGGYFTEEEWKKLEKFKREACTRVTIRTGLEISGLDKYRPGIWWPWHTRIIWVKRHPFYDDLDKRNALSMRMQRLHAVGVRYDIGELLSFVGIGHDDPTEWICSRLPVKNLLADGGPVPQAYRERCSPADYERWGDWKPVTDWMKEV
jgi:hypothetical protein